MTLTVVDLSATGRGAARFVRVPPARRGRGPGQQYRSRERCRHRRSYPFARRLGDSTLTARKLGQLHTGIFAAPSYLEIHGAPSAHPRKAVLDTEWVVTFRGFGSLSFRGAGGALSRVRPAGRVTSDEMTFVQSAIVHGIGLGVLPTFLADADVRQGRLLQVLAGFALASATLLVSNTPDSPQNGAGPRYLARLHHRGAYGPRARLAARGNGDNLCVSRPSRV